MLLGSLGIAVKKEYVGVIRIKCGRIKRFRTSVRYGGATAPYPQEMIQC
jgi:repressor of nif and glnA expression